MRITNDSLRLSLVHSGYDALCVGNIIVQVGLSVSRMSQMIPNHHINF